MDIDEGSGAGPCSVKGDTDVEDDDFIYQGTSDEDNSKEFNPSLDASS